MCEVRKLAFAPKICLTVLPCDYGEVAIPYVVPLTTDGTCTSFSGSPFLKNSHKLLGMCRRLINLRLCFAGRSGRRVVPWRREIAVKVLAVFTCAFDFFYKKPNMVLLHTHVVFWDWENRCTILLWQDRTKWG